MLTEKSDRSSFEQFRSSTCHTFKDLIDWIHTYYEKKWCRESICLLAMLNQLSALNGIPLFSNYNILSAKLMPPYPSEVLLLCGLLHSDPSMADAIEKHPIS